MLMESLSDTRMRTEEDTGFINMTTIEDGSPALRWFPLIHEHGTSQLIALQGDTGVRFLTRRAAPTATTVSRTRPQIFRMRMSKSGSP